MDMSINGFSTYNNMSRVKPMNYALKNNAEVSDAYNASVKETEKAASSNAIDAASPVRYPNARMAKVDAVAAQTNAIQANGQFNAVAAKYEGSTTGYDSAGTSYGYNVVGGSVDFYA